MTRVKLTIVALLAGFFCWDWYGSRFRLDADELLALKPGMTKDEVRVLARLQNRSQKRGV